MMKSVVPVENRNEGAKGSRLHGFVFAFVLFALVWSLCGCNHPGETVAETDRRHLRTLGLNQENMLHDIDTFLLLDEPSRLSDEYMP